MTWPAERRETRSGNALEEAAGDRGGLDPVQAECNVHAQRRLLSRFSGGDSTQAGDS